MRVVRSVEELRQLPHDPVVNGYMSRNPIRLDIVSLPQHSQVYAQRVLNRLQSRCGCLAGSLALLATVALGLTHLLGTTETWLTLATIGRMSMVLLAGFVVGFAAKIVTMAFTRWQFSRVCSSLQQRLVH